MNEVPPDSTDRLFERYELDNPPPNFTARVLARVQAVQRAQRLSVLVCGALLCLLGAFAFALGRGLTFSGALDTLRLLFDNLDVAPEFAADFAAALLDSVPWVEAGAVVAALAGIWFASRLLPRLLANRLTRGG